MAFQAFQTIIIAELQARLGDECQFPVQRVSKNNGQLSNGLCIRQSGQQAAPTIYLDSFFRRYKKGAPLEKLVDEITDIYRHWQLVGQQDYSYLLDFNYLKDKIVYRLIHTASNQQRLQEVPSIPYHDLSIVFYLDLEQDEHGHTTSMISNQQLALWNTSVCELYQLAAANTPRRFPPQLQTMSQVMGQLLRANGDISTMEELFCRILDAPGITPLYVLTNTIGLHGACTILYPQVLKNFAQLLGQDLIILPSSIHEVLLLPYDDDVELSTLSDMVTFVNQTEVPLEERLSNQAYLYSRQTDSVTLIPSSAPSLLS